MSLYKRQYPAGGQTKLTWQWKVIRTSTAEHALVLVTVGDADEARQIARAAVPRRLAAGVLMVPIPSVEEWHDSTSQTWSFEPLSSTYLGAF